MTDANQSEPPFSGARAPGGHLEGGEIQDDQAQQAKGKQLQRGGDNTDMQASAIQQSSSLVSLGQVGIATGEIDDKQAAPTSQPNPEVLRLIQQYLRENGMQKIAQDIEQQTGVDMEHNSVIRFRQCILNGNYKELFSKEIVAHSSLKSGGKCISVFDQVSAQLSPQKKQLLMYFIYEQQYIELMEQGKNIEAITLLQKQLVPHSPFGRDKSNLFKLASMIMKKPLMDCSRGGPNCTDAANGQERRDVIEKRENNKVVMEFEQNTAQAPLLEEGQIRDREVKEEPMNGESPESKQPTDMIIADTQMNDEAQERNMRRTPLDHKIQTMRESLLQKLHVYLPKNSMLLPNRLETLLGQSIEWQISQCQYHNVDETRFSLLKDHTCPPSLIPTTCMATLRRHKEQVWFCKFNNQGDKIATVCKEGQILIWSILKVDSKMLASQMVNQMQNSTTQYRLQLIYEIKEHVKQVSCVSWAPNGNWIVSGSNKDYVGRIWDVSFPHRSAKKGGSKHGDNQPDVSLQNQMVCMLKKHKFQLIKILFHTSTQLVSCSHDKTIIFWEVLTMKNSKGQIYYKARDFRVIKTTKHYLDIAVTQNRFICRRGNPDGNIKIIKFKNLKTDIKNEMFTDEYYKKAKDEAKAGKESAATQPVVDHIDKSDETIMEMMTSACGRFLLLNIRKPWLELWDLTKVPHPKCVQRFYGYQQDSYILVPSFAGINQNFVMIGSEATGEEAAIFIWKRDTGEQLCRIPGSGLFGHTNIIGQVDGSLTEPYMFISCSDDETLKIWGVKDKIKIEVVHQSLQNSSKDGVIKIDVKAEEKLERENANRAAGEGTDESEGNASRRYSSVDDGSDGELLSSSDDDTEQDEDNEEEDEDDDGPSEDDSSQRDTSESEDEDSRMSSAGRGYSQGSMDSGEEEGHQARRQRRPSLQGAARRGGNDEGQQDSDDGASNQSEGGDREQSRRGRRRHRLEEQKRAEQQEGEATEQNLAGNIRMQSITQHEGGSQQTNPSARQQSSAVGQVQGAGMVIGGVPAPPDTEQINDTEMTEEVPESGDPTAQQIQQFDYDNNSQNVAGGDYSETNSYMNDQDLQNEWQNQWNQQVQQQQRDILGQGDWLGDEQNQQDDSHRFW